MTAVPIGILHVSPQRLLLQPQGDSPTVCLTVDRSKATLGTLPSIDSHPYDRQVEVFGFVGVAALPTASYLCVATAADAVAKIDGVQVLRVTQTKFVPFSAAHDQQVPDSDESLIKLAEQQLNSGFVYVATGLDLTLTAERRSELSHDTPGWKSINDEFFWNKAFSAPLFDAGEELREWIQPMVCGFVEGKGFVLNGNACEVVFVSRRSRHRMGVRLFSRGGDSQGNVSNFVETEQLLFGPDGAMSSFVQIRGSIPVLWTQHPNINYKPKPTLAKEDSTPCFQRHAEKLVKRYNHIVCINLVDQKGGELTLADAFDQQCKKLSNPRYEYVAFDFHRECSKMRYDKLSILMDRVASQEKEFGYFFRDAAGAVVKRQTGVFRTNCVDCLDRTNVVQSLFDRHSLQKQFVQMGILRSGEKFEVHAEFEHFFKNAWADHADAISTQYSGTGALKTDFTRTGKRSIAGAIQDGKNSLMRYYLNNFQDGQRQDSYDFVLGAHSLDNGSLKAKPYRPNGPTRWIILFFFVYLWLVATAVVPPSTSILDLIVFVIVQALVLAALFFIALKAAPWLVDHPQLVPLSKKAQ